MDERTNIKFNWSKVSDGANLSFFVISEMLNDVLNIEISIAKNVYRNEIKRCDFTWYDSFSEEGLAELSPYLRYNSENEKEIVRSEASRYLRANIFNSCDRNAQRVNELQTA